MYLTSVVLCTCLFFPPLATHHGSYCGIRPRLQEKREAIPIHVTTAADSIVDGNETTPPPRPPPSFIVGGHEAKPNSWPWLAYILMEDSNGKGFICSGSLLSDRYVLTAAHCLLHQRMTVFFGVHSFNLFDVTGMEDVYTNRGVRRKIPHPKYDPEKKKLWNGSLRYGYDIAILELDNPVIFEPKIQPICLPDKNAASEPDNELECFSTGWGKVSGGWTPYELQELQAGIKPYNECSPWFEKHHGFTLANGTICLRVPQHQTLCQGDSGGPLNCRRREGNLDGPFVVRAVAKFAEKGCDEPDSYYSKIPSGYTDVVPFLDWIETHMIAPISEGQNGLRPILGVYFMCYICLSLTLRNEL